MNDVLVSFLLRFVAEAAQVPLAYIDMTGFGAGFPFFYYVGVGGLMYFNRPRVLTKVFLILLIGLNVAVFTGLARQERNALTLTAIDVGEGDALLIEFPNKKQVLLDAGPKTFSYDAGERVIAPFLKRQGITNLDAIIISHPHSDHIGGIQYLLEHFPVAQLIQSERSSNSRQYKEMHAVAAQRGVKIHTVKSGDALPFDSTARMLVLHPCWARDSTMNFNNSSLVLKVLYGSSSFLLMGDAEGEAEEKLIGRFDALLDSDVLKVGHHGSITSTSDTLLQQVSPTIAIVSVGRYNKFNHPSLEVIDKLKRQRIETKRTDEEGAVILRSDGRKVQIVDWR
jgi:competence protein ComEC